MARFGVVISSFCGHCAVWQQKPVVRNAGTTFIVCNECLKSVNN